MKSPEIYWSYKSPPIPEIKDLPLGVFKGDEREWNRLSPGMRQTIWREAVKKLDPETGSFCVPVPGQATSND